MHFNVHDLIIHYGYLALLIGCMAEGETFVLLGGIAAHNDLLNLGGVIIASMFGGIIGDQILFWLGRRYGSKIIARFEKYPEKIDKARNIINRYPAWFVIGSRFMYGFRIMGPILIGSSGLSRKVFLLMNVIGAAIWAVLFSCLGFYAGKIITPWLSQLDNYIQPIFWTIALIVMLLAIWKLVSMAIQWTKNR